MKREKNMFEKDIKIVKLKHIYSRFIAIRVKI